MVNEVRPVQRAAWSIGSMLIIMDVQDSDSSMLCMAGSITECNVEIEL